MVPRSMTWRRATTAAKAHSAAHTPTAPTRANIAFRRCSGGTRGVSGATIFIQPAARTSVVGWKRTIRSR
jgi:hypothetical protein